MGAMENLQDAEEELIPGLPFYLASLCLIKVPRLFHMSLRAVSRSWRHFLCSQDFYRSRRVHGFSDPWLVIVSTDRLGSPELGFFAYDLTSRQLLFKAPLLPFNMCRIESCGADDYKLVAVNEFFVVLNWQKNGVWTEELPFLIYNSLTNSYKKGAHIAVRRQSFACGVINGKLYVAAGFNLEGRFEHSTECYDFVQDEWKFMASLPRTTNAGSDQEYGVDTLLEVDDDAVFQGQLYLRCRRQRRCHHPTCDTLYFAYDPVSNEWREKPCLSFPPSPANDGQLAATDHALFSLTRDNRFYRFDDEGRGWTLVGKIGGDVRVHDSSPQQQYMNGLSTEAKRVFAYGNDIFVLAAGVPGFHSTPLGKDGCRYHRLFLGNSSYRAGAVVLA